jgi:hypothetical protein
VVAVFVMFYKLDSSYLLYITINELISRMNERCADLLLTRIQSIRFVIVIQSRDLSL